MPQARAIIIAAVLAVVTLLVHVRPLGSQPPPKPSSIALVVALLPYIDDETVQRELKLTTEQLQRLLERRKQVWDDEFTLSPKELAASEEERAGATEKVFQQVLSEAQHKRARELSGQVVWDYRLTRMWSSDRGVSPPPLDLHRISADALVKYTEFADALKPDGIQRKHASSSNRFFKVYLTQEQAAVAKKMLGAVVKTHLRARRDERVTRIGPGPWYTPPSIRDTVTRDVQKELKLSEEQKAALAELRARWRTFRPEDDLSREVQKRKLDQLLAEIDQRVGQVLTPFQRKRLEQLHYQRSFPWSDDRSELGKALGITEEQRQKYSEASFAYYEAVARAVLHADRPSDATSDLEAAEAKFDTAVPAILTPHQRVRRRELHGDWFLGGVGGFRAPWSGFSLVERRSLTFGKYGTELARLTQHKLLRDELNLSEDQSRQARAAIIEIDTRIPPRDLPEDGEDAKLMDRYLSDRSVLIAKALNDILSREQLSRFRQIVLQQLEAGVRVDFIGQSPTPAIYPGVAEAIRLTSPQKDRLLSGDKPANVLSDDQNRAIKKMLGAPVDVAKLFTQTDSERMRVKWTPDLDMAKDTSVWDALHLTSEQRGMLARAANKYYVTVSRPNWSDPPPPAEQLEAAVEEFTKAKNEIFSAEQQKRLDQLLFQQSAAKDLGRTIVTQAKALGLSQTQMMLIQRDATDYRELATHITYIRLRDNRNTEVRQEFRAKWETRILKHLDSEQKKKWQELVGEPCWAIVEKESPPLGN
jgi:hypothetical protein